MALLNASSEAQATELWLQHDCEWRGCVWEGVYCMCRMCYVISACQAGVSGINKHATKITEQESDTHAHTHRWSIVAGIRGKETTWLVSVCSRRVRVYITLSTRVLKTYMVSRGLGPLVNTIKHVSLFFYCLWATYLHSQSHRDCSLALLAWIYLYGLISALRMLVGDNWINSACLWLFLCVCEPTDLERLVGI